MVKRVIKSLFYAAVLPFFVAHNAVLGVHCYHEGHMLLSSFMFLGSINMAMLLIENMIRETRR